MGLRFFADHCVPNLVIQTLLDAGHEVFRLKDYIPIESSDQTVITTAQELNSILISLNGDFADTLSYPPKEYKRLVSLQVRNHPEIIPQLMIRLINYVSLRPDQEAFRGKLIIVEVSRIRIRG